MKLLIIARNGQMDARMLKEWDITVITLTTLHNRRFSEHLQQSAKENELLYVMHCVISVAATVTRHGFDYSRDIFCVEGFPLQWPDWRVIYSSGYCMYSKHVTLSSLNPNKSILISGLLLLLENMEKVVNCGIQRQWGKVKKRIKVE